MNRFRMWFFWIPLIITGSAIFIVSGVLLFFSIMEFRPATIQDEPTCKEGPALPPGKTRFTLLTWNVGYGGLGHDMDFFYDGGERVRAPRNRLEYFIQGISGLLQEMDSIDFILLQEVDIHSRRSFYLDENHIFSTVLTGCCSLFTCNYDCLFVPLPLHDPMGRVKSGLLSLMKYKPECVSRYAFDINFPWPKRLFFLKRCFVPVRYRLLNGKELIIINLHNSAYDLTGKLQKRELEQIGQFIHTEFLHGNYIVAGGDWNISPPGFDPLIVTTGDFTRSIPMEFPSEYYQGWVFAFDASVPSNRDVAHNYVRRETPTTVIDFFLVSPNITVKRVKTFDQQFAFSDHHPVFLEIQLIE